MKRILIWDVETNGLSPLFGDRATAIGCKVMDSNEGLLVSEYDECLLLKKFEKWFKENTDEKTILCGYNHIKFDIPFIYTRFLKNGLDAPEFLLEKKIIDPFTIAQKWISLNDMAKILNVDVRKNGTGFEAIKLWEQGRIDELLMYLKQDLVVTEAVVKKLIEIGTLKV